jgi:hypothetical protein
LDDDDDDIEEADNNNETAKIDNTIKEELATDVSAASNLQLDDMKP